MIGWINLSVEAFICDSFGRDAWLQIIKQAHVDCNWVSSCPYPDKVTYDLVITGAGILGVSVPQALEAYGQYFVKYVISQGYTRLMRSLGPNIAHFLANLNNLHLHLTMGFPSMVAPAFRVEQVTPTSLLLHYQSMRPALWPIVSGVLKGVAPVLFSHEVQVELIASRDAGDCDHEIFRVSYPHQASLSSWDDRAAARASLYAMSHDFFFHMFPFHLIIDTEGCLVQAGAVMSRLYGSTLVRGAPLTDTFTLRHPFIPFEYDKMVMEADSVFLLKALSLGLEFKGQMVKTSLPSGQPVLLFLGSPRLSTLEEMDTHGLYLADIPLHDMSRDFVMLAEQRQAEADLKERFEKTTVELRVANERLEEATRWLDEEKKRSDALLYRMLPADIAQDLRDGRQVEAISYPEVTILFSDIVGFTSTSMKATPEEVYNMLNEMYDKIDALADEYPDIYKLETIGDAYFLVCNLTTDCHDHVDVVIDFAIRMQDIARHVKNAQGEPVQIRVGIHTGPVVGGVLGRKTPRFSVYGDTVNVASRMESHGVPGKIHISSASYSRIVNKHKYAVRERGNINVKGRGNVTTYLIGGINDDWLLRHSSFDLQVDYLRSNSGSGSGSGMVAAGPAPRDTSFVVTASGRSVDIMASNRSLLVMEAIKEGDEDRASRGTGLSGPNALSGTQNPYGKGAYGRSSTNTHEHMSSLSLLPDGLSCAVGPANLSSGANIVSGGGGGAGSSGGVVSSGGLPPLPPGAILSAPSSLITHANAAGAALVDSPSAVSPVAATMTSGSSFVRAVYARGGRSSISPMHSGRPSIGEAADGGSRPGSPAPLSADDAAGSGAGSRRWAAGGAAGGGQAASLQRMPSELRGEAAGGMGVGLSLARSATSKASPLQQTMFNTSAAASFAAAAAAETEARAKAAIAAAAAEAEAGAEAAARAAAAAEADAKMKVSAPASVDSLRPPAVGVNWVADGGEPPPPPLSPMQAALLQQLRNSALAETSPDGAARRGSAGSSVGLGSDAGLGLAPGALASGGRPVSGASASDLLSSREVDPGGKGGKSKGLAKKLKNLFKK